MDGLLGAVQYICRGTLGSKATIDLLEVDFAHLGYPHTLVSDNATTFTSEEFQEWCKSREIVHLTGAPYHPATNGAAERLVQAFKGSLTKSATPPRVSLQRFLMQYRRTPLLCGYSPGELLNGRQIRTTTDVLIPSPAHQARGRQGKQAAKAAQRLAGRSGPQYRFGTPCYAVYYGPRRDKDPRWVPAVVTKVRGARSVCVRVYPKGLMWQRHVEQLRPRYVSDEDVEPGETPTSLVKRGHHSNGGAEEASSQMKDKESSNAETSAKRKRRNPGIPTGNKYGPDRPRRSRRTNKPKFT